MQRMVHTVNGTISAPLSALYNKRPSLFRFIFVGNFFILFFFHVFFQTFDLGYRFFFDDRFLFGTAYFSSIAYCSIEKCEETFLKTVIEK